MKIDQMKGNCSILVFYLSSLFFFLEKRRKMLLSCNPVCKVQKILVITFFKNRTQAGLHQMRQSHFQSIVPLGRCFL